METAQAGAFAPVLDYTPGPGLRVPEAETQVETQVQTQVPEAEIEISIIQPDSELSEPDVVSVPRATLEGFQNLIAALEARIAAIDSPKVAKEKKFVPTSAVWVVGERPDKWEKTPQVARIQQIVHAAFPAGSRVPDADMISLISAHPEISAKQDPVRILRYYRKQLGSVSVA